MKFCAACGSPLKGGIGIGSALLCRQCEPEVKQEIDTTRAAGKPVNALHIARRIYKKAHSGGDYLLRDAPADLMQQARHRAVDDKCSVRDVILSALHEYLS